jgi:hypothetical protein
MNPDRVYRQGFLRAVNLVREAIQINRNLTFLDRQIIEQVLDQLEERTQKPMLTNMQGVI